MKSLSNSSTKNETTSSLTTQTSQSFSSGQKTAWTLKYIPPGTSKNQSRFWKLPKLKVILEDLLCAGGVVKTLLEEINSDHSLQQLLQLQISLELQKEENKALQAEWQKIVMTSQRDRMVIGTDKLLNEFMATGKGQQAASLIQRIGANLSPESFGKEGTAPRTDNTNRSDAERMAADLEGDA